MSTVLEIFLAVLFVFANATIWACLVLAGQADRVMNDLPLPSSFDPDEPQP